MIEHLVDDQVALLVNKALVLRATKVLRVKLVDCKVLVQHTRFLLIVSMRGELLDQSQRLSSLVTHQAHGAVVDHRMQCHQIVVFQMILTDEVICQVVPQLHTLLLHVWEVNEKPGTHVTLDDFDVNIWRSFVTVNYKVTVFQQTTATDLLRFSGSNEFLVQVLSRWGL